MIDPLFPGFDAPRVRSHLDNNIEKQGREWRCEGHPRRRHTLYVRPVSDNELAAFLRSRREAITPAEAGLPTGPRRRAPGLRRAELATLAGISVEYLTRLEQGRDRTPSSQVLGALADALCLRVPDRDLLRRLAKESGDEKTPCPAPAPPARTVRPTVRALLDRLEPTPAVLLDRLGDIVAHTSGYERFARPLGLLDGTPPNVLRYLFTDERARTSTRAGSGSPTSRSPICGTRPCRTTRMSPP